MDVIIDLTLTAKQKELDSKKKIYKNLFIGTVIGLILLGLIIVIIVILVH
jgi:hypothetical protein